MSRKWTPSQEAAISLRGKTLLVSAAAGSGKTSVLTERIIRSLTDKEHPADLSRILVVTFTRAAAADLKAKIAAALTDALATDPENRRLSSQLLMLGSAQISTIDSFFQKIVRANFEQLGLPATFRIADKSEILPISVEVLSELIEEYYEKYKENRRTGAVFDAIEGNRFAKAMDHLLSNRSDGKLNAVLLDFLENFYSYPEGISLLKESADELRRSRDLPYFQTRYGEGQASYFESLFIGYENDISHIRASLSYDPEIADKCEPLLATDEAFCSAMKDAAKKRDYTRMQKVVFSFFSGRFPTIRPKPEPVTAYHNWHKALCKNVTEKIQPLLQYPSEVISYHMDQTADFCEILYQFYHTYEQRMMAEKQKRGMLEHNDIRTMLYRLLTDPNGMPAAFAEELASQYDAVYIDEYQDVDSLQDRIFALIGGNRRFMVGDIKQSIYGFRGSDPSIFAAYRKNMPLHTEDAAASSDGVCVFMSNNFRCNRPVIDFANQVCSFLFSACEESVGYRPQDDLVCSKSDPQSPPASYPTPVKAVVFDAPNTSSAEPRDDTEDGRDDENNGSAEAVWVAAEISKLLREERLDNGKSISPSDIAILVRTHAQGKAFMAQLRALNIPVASEGGDDLLHAPILTDVLNLLRAVDNPYRDLPLSEFLLSSLGGFSLEELTTLRECSSEQQSLFDAMTAATADIVPSPLSEKTAATLRWFKQLRENAAVLPADRFLRLLYLDERLTDFSSEASLRFLYDQARLYQKSSWCGLYGFLHHIEKLLEGKKISAAGFAKAESAVTVMTVHHSKGLEFPVVFLCACGAGFSKTDAKEKLVYHRSMGCATTLYDAVTGESQNTVLRDAVRRQIDADQTEESIRTLYVALTRARERLYVTGTLRAKWDTAIAAATSVRRGNRASILACNSYLSWILASIFEKSTQNAAFCCDFLHLTQEDVQSGIPFEDTMASVSERLEVADSRAARYADVQRNMATFQYELDALRGLPTKIAASKLTANLVDQLKTDEEDETALEAMIQLMETAAPSFETLLGERSRASAADIGTATHTFLEFCDFSRLLQIGTEAECEQLIAERFMTATATALVDRKQIQAFCNSDLMNWIKQAKSVRREQKFSMLLPLSTLTEDPSLAERFGDQPLFVQGSIDLLLITSDQRIILVDYKTDRISDAERNNLDLLRKSMTQKHGEQLACYVKATKQMFGRAPDQACIYSLPLGATVEIFLPDQSDK